MLFGLVWGLTYEMKRNFEHLVQETQLQTCDQMVFKFLKKQTKSENHEIFHNVMVSYMKVVVKNWKSFAYIYFVMYDVYKSKHLRGRLVALRRIQSDFETKWRLNCGLTTKLFVLVIENIGFGKFLRPFDNFNVLNAIIEF